MNKFKLEKDCYYKITFYSIDYVAKMTDNKAYGHYIDTRKGHEHYSTCGCFSDQGIVGLDKPTTEEIKQLNECIKVGYYVQASVTKKRAYEIF